MDDKEKLSLGMKAMVITGMMVQATDEELSQIKIEIPEALIHKYAVLGMAVNRAIIQGIASVNESKSKK